MVVSTGTLQGKRLSSESPMLVALPVLPADYQPAFFWLILSFQRGESARHGGSVSLLCGLSKSGVTAKRYRRRCQSASKLSWV